MATPVFVLAVAALLVPFDVAFVRASRIIFCAVPGAYLPIERQLLVLVIALVPVAALFGLAFAVAAWSDAAGGRLAAAYAAECAGAAAAGLAATVAFRLGAQNFAVAIVVAAAGMAACVGCRREAARESEGDRQPEGWRLHVAVAILALGLFAAWSSGPLDARLTRWTHPTLIETRDTPYARVTITRTGAQVAVFENDVLAHDSESVSNQELPHLAALQRPTGASILLLGGTVESMDAALALHRPLHLRHVEMDGVMVDAVRRVLPLSLAPQIADPRAVVSEDGSYDLVVIATGAPVSGQSNRFYTREFFEACARRLSPGGVLALRLDVPANYLGPSALLRAASVARALRGVFRYTDFLPGIRTIALASNDLLPSAEAVVARVEQRRLGTQLVTPSYVGYLYANDRREELRTAFATTTAPENRDSRPVAYLYAAASWLSKFWPSLIGADWARATRWDRWPAASRWGLVVALALALAASVLRPGTRPVAIALVAGVAGMLLETIVLLHYQAAKGALFEDLGLLMMAFMAGSAAGSWGSLAGREPRPNAVTVWCTPPRLRAKRYGAASPRASRRRAPLRAGAALPLVALTGWGVLSWWVVSAEIRIGTLSATVALAAIGATVGALFAAASAQQEEGEGAGRLYGADVAGGAIGSLAASLFLVPLAGIGVTALIVSGLAAASLVLASGRIPR